MHILRLLRSCLVAILALIFGAGCAGELVSSLNVRIQDCMRSEVPMCPVGSMSYGGSNTDSLVERLLLIAWASRSTARSMGTSTDKVLALHGVAPIIIDVGECLQGSYRAGLFYKLG